MRHAAVVHTKRPAVCACAAASRSSPAALALAAQHAFLHDGASLRWAPRPTPEKWNGAYRLTDRHTCGWLRFGARLTSKSKPDGHQWLCGNERISNPPASTKIKATRLRKALLTHVGRWSTLSSQRLSVCEFMKATCRKPQEQSSEAALRHENTLPSKRFALWALQPCNSGLPATRKTSGEWLVQQPRASPYPQCQCCSTRTKHYMPTNASTSNHFLCLITTPRSKPRATTTKQHWHTKGRGEASAIAKLYVAVTSRVAYPTCHWELIDSLKTKPLKHKSRPLRDHLISHVLNENRLDCHVRILCR